MSNTPSDEELTACYREANGEMHGKAQPLTTQRIFRAMRAAIVKWGTPAPVGVGAVPQGWKAVPVNPTPEMWKAAKTVPDPNPPYPPHYGLVWDAMLAAAPSIEQGGQHDTNT